MVGSGRRAKERCDILGGSAYSDSPDYLYRPYLGRGHREALDQVAEWMRDAGMTTRIDAAGNLVGRYNARQPADLAADGTPLPPPFGRSPLPGLGGSQNGAGELLSSQSGVVAAKTLLIASHIDSVRDAGRYDGPLGIMLGIEAVAAVEGRRLPFAIEVYAFGDEEGSRFPAAMLTSRAVAGSLREDDLDVADRDGISLHEALLPMGLGKPGFLAARRDPGELLAYVEAHIEQGPVLEAEGLALGTVTAIAAQLRFEATVRGVAGHAGTNAMGLRKDALTAAAEMVLGVERIARAGPGDLVATVGRMTVGPGAPNVVPGHVAFTIDVRAGTEAVRDEAAAAIHQALNDIAAERNIALDVRLVHDLPASPCDPHLMELMDHAVTGTGQAPRRLVSGAGHDAMVFAKIVPTAMLFIRCKGGVSHNPLESVTVADCEAALAALSRFIELLNEPALR